MQDRARVVIVGGGIAGASIAFHLAKLGVRDVLVLEQGELVSGTTAHAPGLVGQLRSDPTLTHMLMHSVSLYRDLRVNGEPGYFEVGGLRLASSKERLEEIQRQAACAKQVGLEAHLVGPADVARLFPLVNLDGVEGALFIPSDGSATATILARALMNEAAAMGVTLQSQARVRSIEKAAGRVRAVETNVGRVETEHLVVACGIWSPQVGRLAGVELPLVPMHHQYAETTDLPELAAAKKGAGPICRNGPEGASHKLDLSPFSPSAGQSLPNLRDPDKLVYLRQRDRAIVLGGYERDPRPFDAAIPDRRDPTVHEFDAAHFEPLCRAAALRVPAIGSTGIARGVNGLESFTPDGEFLLGPSRDVPNLWAACGFCAHGVSGAGGVGKVLSEWIVRGDPGCDLSHMAIDRFGPRAADAAFVRDGAIKVYSTYYDLRRTD